MVHYYYGAAGILQATAYGRLFDVNVEYRGGPQRLAKFCHQTCACEAIHILNWAIQILVCMNISKHGHTIGHYYLPEFEPLTGLPISPHLPDGGIFEPR